jgi:hypothetical protein
MKIAWGNDNLVCMHPRNERQLGIQFGGMCLIKTEICGQCGKVLKVDTK